MLNHFQNNKFSKSPKLKEFADDNFKFDIIQMKSSVSVEIAVGKSEIAHYEQFLFFPQQFSKDLF